MDPENLEETEICPPAQIRWFKKYEKNIPYKNWTYKYRFLSNRNISLFSELRGILISRIYFISCTGLCGRNDLKFWTIQCVRRRVGGPPPMFGSNEMLFIVEIYTVWVTWVGEFYFVYKLLSIIVFYFVVLTKRNKPEKRN